MLHLVDLDAAFGETPQRALVERIVRRAAIPVQVGGGVRTLEDFLALRASGAARVVFGTAAAGESRRRLPGPRRGRRPCGRGRGRERRKGCRARLDRRNRRESSRSRTKVGGGGSRELRLHRSRARRRHGRRRSLRDRELCARDRRQGHRFGGCRLSRSSASAQIHRVAGIEGVIVGRALYEKAFTLAEAQGVLGSRFGG